MHPKPPPPYITGPEHRQRLAEMQIRVARIERVLATVEVVSRALILDAGLPEWATWPTGMNDDIQGWNPKASWVFNRRANTRDSFCRAGWTVTMKVGGDHGHPDYRPRTDDDTVRWSWNSDPDDDESRSQMSFYKDHPEWLKDGKWKKGSGESKVMDGAIVFPAEVLTLIRDTIRPAEKGGSHQWNDPEHWMKQCR